MDKIKVIITNKQKDVKIPTGLRMLIRRCCNAVLQMEEFEGSVEVSVTLVNDKQIKELNAIYRNKDSVTDVLSFPMGENGKYRIDRYHEIKSKPLADSLCSYCNKVFNHSQAIFNLNKGNVPSARDISVEIKAQKNILRHEEYLVSAETVNKDQIGITPLVGLGRRNNRLNHTILYLLESAASEITIYTPYFNLPSPIRKRINFCLKKGVFVTIVCGDKVANDFYIHDLNDFNKVGAIPYLYEINLRKFISANQSFIDSGRLKVHLWKDGDNTYHVKGMTVDRQYALLTGNNLNPRAWGLDLENGLLINDSSGLLVPKFIHEKKFLLEHTSQIRSELDIEDIMSYPEPVKKVLSKVNKFGAQWLIKKLL